MPPNNKGLDEQLDWRPLHEAPRDGRTIILLLHAAIGLRGVKNYYSDIFVVSSRRDGFALVTWTDFEIGEYVFKNEMAKAWAPINALDGRMVG